MDPAPGIVTTAVRLPPVLFVAVVLHTAVLPELRVFDVAADLLLLVGICAALTAGAQRGAWVAFVCGLLADCFLQTPFGLSALAFTLVGWLVGTTARTVQESAWWLPVVVAGVASSLGVLAFATIGAVVGEEHLLSGRIIVVTLVVGGLNTVLSPLVLRVTRWAMADVSEPVLALR